MSLTVHTETVHGVPVALLATTDWLDRCAARVRERDEAITLDDAKELAWFMFTQDRFRSMPPEVAVDTLFLSQL